MFNFFNRKKTNSTPVQKIAVKAINYHPKIILAWAKALEGNEDLSRFLAENGFEELNVANAAIKLNAEARDWLMKNGYPHLMAMINASEGDVKAQKWLQINGFEILYHIAMAIEEEQTSWQWLKNNTTPDIFLLTQTIKKVKDQIEENHNDVHSFGKDL